MGKSSPVTYGTLLAKDTEQVGLLTIIRKNKAKSKEMRVLFLYVHSLLLNYARAGVSLLSTSVSNERG